MVRKAAPIPVDDCGPAAGIPDKRSFATTPHREWDRAAGKARTSMFQTIRSDIDAMISRDPAARSRIEVALCYPAFHAILLYRASSWLWRRNWRLTARMVSQFARWTTGIEIHPGATIGHGFFIDHGMGVVIGETAEIGDNVTLYHDVTLGGVSPAEDSDGQRCTKRHPTLCDGVIVGSGAQILGPITVGKGARVGANAVVIKNVAEGATMVGIPAKPVTGKAGRATGAFSPYGTPLGDLPDPAARAIEGLMQQVETLKTQIGNLESRLAEAEKRPSFGFAVDDDAETARQTAKK
ncbi:MAG: serine O-acetyltransferase [Alphaproteobacteria bacterium]|nr:serine O-acetyltransferase [Alphaproteobacteria bacterium]MBO6864497.1 serine O-acetyltransferase [Alphaproteobacteria bacterium]